MKAPRDPVLPPDEQRWFALFSRLGSVAPPGGLLERLLDAFAEESRDWSDGARRWSAGARRWVAAASMAAGLLVSVGVFGLSRAAGQAAREADAAQARDALPLREVAVVDDPSVPLFHDVDTFGGLEPAVGLDGGDAPGDR